jgi:tetratricopeptide (TPR) repeat protein
MVERSTDNLQSLSLAAETAARIGRYNYAVDFRERIARANPTDATNRLELARAMAAGGRNGEAIDAIATLIAERTTPNSIRAQGAEVIGDIVRADRSQATRAAQLLDRGAGQSDAGALLARAAVAEATGSMDEARSLLGRINAGGLAAVAQMKLGLIALGAQNAQEAIAAFERAVYLDSDDEITNAIAFRAAGPRVQLVRLYGRAGRDLAAIRMAEGDGSDGKSLISAEVRRALAAGEAESEGGQETIAVAFEPSLEVARARATGLRPIAELNSAAAEAVDNALLETLAQSAARLGQYDRAIAIERLRAADATRPEDRAAIEKLLAEMIAQDRARRAREASLHRIDLTSTTEAIYKARAEGD